MYYFSVWDTITKLGQYYCEYKRGCCYCVEALCGHYYSFDATKDALLLCGRKYCIACTAQRGALLLSLALLQFGALSVWHYFLGVTKVMRAQYHSDGWYCLRGSRIGRLCIGCGRCRKSKEQKTLGKQTLQRCECSWKKSLWLSGFR